MTIYEYITKDEYLTAFNMPAMKGNDVTDDDYKRAITLASQEVNWLCSGGIGTTLSITDGYINTIGKNYTASDREVSVKYATALLAKQLIDRGFKWLRGSASTSEGVFSVSQTNPDEPDYIPKNVTRMLENAGLFFRQESSSLNLQIMHAPAHTQDCKCIFADGVLLSKVHFASLTNVDLNNLSAIGKAKIKQHAHDPQTAINTTAIAALRTDTNLSFKKISDLETLLNNDYWNKTQADARYADKKLTNVPNSDFLAKAKAAGVTATPGIHTIKLADYASWTALHDAFTNNNGIHNIEDNAGVRYSGNVKEVHTDLIITGFKTDISAPAPIEVGQWIIKHGTLVVEQVTGSRVEIANQAGEVHIATQALKAYLGATSSGLEIGSTDYTSVFPGRPNAKDDDFRLVTPTKYANFKEIIEVAQAFKNNKLGRPNPLIEGVDFNNVYELITKTLFEVKGNWTIIEGQDIVFYGIPDATHSATAPEGRITGFKREGTKVTWGTYTWTNTSSSLNRYTATNEIDLSSAGGSGDPFTTFTTGNKETRTFKPDKTKKGNITLQVDPQETALSIFSNDETVFQFKVGNNGVIKLLGGTQTDHIFLNIKEILHANYSSATNGQVPTMENGKLVMKNLPTSRSRASGTPTQVIAMSKNKDVEASIKILNNTPTITSRDVVNGGMVISGGQIDLQNASGKKNLGVYDMEDLNRVWAISKYNAFNGNVKEGDTLQYSAKKDGWVLAPRDPNKLNHVEINQEVQEYMDQIIKSFANGFTPFIARLNVKQEPVVIDPITAVDKTLNWIETASGNQAKTTLGTKDQHGNVIVLMHRGA